MYLQSNLTPLHHFFKLAQHNRLVDCTAVDPSRRHSLSAAFFCKSAHDILQLYFEMNVLRFAMKLLLMSSVFPGTISFVNKNLASSNTRKSSPCVRQMSTTDRPLPTVVECDLAYDSWMKLYDTIPMTAPNYLTKEACIKKFRNLAKASGDSAGALAMVANDPGVLRFKEETVSESYSAWLRKFDGDKQKTLELCVRAPMILALKSKVVDEAKEADVYQTIFFSYVAVVFRGPTKALQMLLKLIFRL